MKRKLIACAIAAVATLAVGRSADASPIAIIVTNTTCSGTTAYACTGFAVGTSTTATFSAPVGDVLANVVVTLTNNPGTPGVAFVNTSDIELQTLSDGPLPAIPTSFPEQISIQISQLDFTLPAGNTTLFTSLSGTLTSNATPQSVSLQSGGDAANGAFVLGTATAPVTCSGGGGNIPYSCGTPTASVPFTTSGPYSLTQLFLINLAASGQVAIGGTTTVLSTPEPGSLTLLGSGLLGLIVRARRKNRLAKMA